MRQRLLDAFLDMDRERPEDAAALRAAGAGGFLPADDRNYAAIADAVRAAQSR